MPASRITYIKPVRNPFSGGKIGIQGNRIWLFPERLTLRFSQGVIEVDEVADGVGDVPLIFYGDRNITGVLRVQGDYGATTQHERYALNEMTKISPVEDVTISLDSGVTYTGNLTVLSDQNDWNPKPKVQGDAYVSFDMTFRFTGTIVGDGSTGSFDEGSQTVFTNLKAVTRAVQMEYSRSYVDQREDRAREPFIIVGIPEDSGVPLSVAEAAVVASLGGANHNWQGISNADGGIPFHMITSRWAGVNIIVGDLIYDRSATDCKAHQYESDIGFVVKGSEGEVITGDSGSDADNVCTDLASGPFAARFTHWRNATVPYTIHLIPCVWATNPKLDTNLKGMIGKINSNAITIEGESIPATELRFDGIKNLRKYTSPTGSKWVGFLKLSELEGGWTDGTLTCARLEPLPITNGGLLPSYTVIASVIQLYDYTRTPFRTIAQLCSACYA